MERIKKTFGATVFATLFLSMVVSLFVSLSARDVSGSVAFCPQTHQDVFIYDADEQEPEKKHKILIEKNGIAAEPPLARYDVIKTAMLSPKLPHFIELPTDIFYPPKAPTV
jgi:hypothetical protein